MPKRSFARTSSRVVHNTKNDGRRRSGDGKHGNDKPWWKRFFFEDDDNWLGLRGDDMELDAGSIEGSEDEKCRGEASEGDKFEVWRKRAEAIGELREGRVDALIEEGRMWEDWVMDDQGDGLSWGRLQRGREWRVILIRIDELGDMLYEDRMFEYASTNSAKFLAVLIIIPCLGLCGS